MVYHGYERVRPLDRYRDMIKVGIDASRVRNGMTGAGRYAAGMFAPLDVAMPDAQFILYTRENSPISLPSGRWRVWRDPHWVWRRLPLTFWIHFRLAYLVNADRPDVLWAPNTLTPKGLHASIPCVTSVLDFNHVLVPETLPPTTRIASRRWMDANVKAAAKNVAISVGTAQRMLDLLGRKADAIAYPAVPSMPAPPEEAAAVHILSEFGIRRPFLLTVGTRAPRKNLASAVAAMEILRHRGCLLDHQLVMAGPEAWDRGGRAIERKKGRDWIKPLGFVDDRLLAALYATAEALVFPSLYEGFGMPVVEARAYGCRVVATDSPELREAGGDDAIYVDSTPEAIAAGIQTALAQPHPQCKKIEYNWNQAASVMACMFRQTVSLKT